MTYIREILVEPMPHRIICFTDNEIKALEDFFPRVTVANVVQADTPLHTALRKLVPKSLPTSLR